MEDRQSAEEISFNNEFHSILLFNKNELERTGEETDEMLNFRNLNKARNNYQVVPE